MECPYELLGVSRDSGGGSVWFCGAPHGFQQTCFFGVEGGFHQRKPRSKLGFANFMIFPKISCAKENHHFFLLWGCRRETAFRWWTHYETLCIIKRLGYTWYTFEKPCRNLNLQVQIPNLPHNNFWGVVLVSTYLFVRCNNHKCVKTPL